MKPTIYFTILLFFLSNVAGAQELSKEFGKIGKPEISYASCPDDKSASAAVLFDIGKSRFEDSERGFDVVYEKTTRIKIFTDAGIKWAEVEIPYYQEGGIYEQVFDLEAYTYNPVGESITRTVLNPSTCHDEKLNESWNVRKFAFPDVKPGSICEYRYKIRSQYKFNLRDWEFQSKIPTLYSEYEIRMIPFYEYTYILQGRSKFDSSVSAKDDGLTRQFGALEYNDMVHRFKMFNIPAFNDEEYITSINDYIVKLEFQLVKINNPDGTIVNVISTWPDLIKDLLKDENLTRFAKKCEKSAQKFITPDSLGNKSKRDVFEYVMNYIKANFNWDHSYRKYSSKSPSELLKDKFGNSADLNLLAVGLLNASGIEAYPLLSSSRDHGRIKNDYPLLGSFNYVMVAATVDGKCIVTDATEVLCPNDLIPSGCINDKGLLIKEGPVQWISLQQSAPSEMQTEIVVDSVDLNPEARIVVKALKYDAIRYRSSYGEDKKKIAEKESGQEYKIDEASVSVTNAFRKDSAYTFRYQTGFKAEAINNKIYISPFLNEMLTENPLKLNSRSYPVDMSYPARRSFSSVITIPEGYKTDFLPKEGKIANDLFELNYNIRSDEKTITVTFNYYFKKGLYQATDYAGLKYYFNEIIKKGNEKVVLVKV
jgi:hypothetical protein